MLQNEVRVKASLLLLEQAIVRLEGPRKTLLGGFIGRRKSLAPGGPAQGLVGAGSCPPGCLNTWPPPQRRGPAGPSGGHTAQD